MPAVKPSSRLTWDCHLGPRRRVAGLRREEVALLASISPTYLTILEQGRGGNPSSQVIDALADALHLTPSERQHVHVLAHGVDRPHGSTPEILSQGLSELVEHLDPHPAYVTGRRWDILVSNLAARALWTDWPSLPAEERNMVWWTFTDPDARNIFVDWDTEAAALLARFRAATARHLHDPSFDELLERLRTASAEVRSWWPRHEVAPISSGRKRLRHPELGELELELTVLHPADDLDQKLVVFTPTSIDRVRLSSLVTGLA